MMTYNDLGETPFSRSRRLKMLIDNGEVQVGGNRKLKIFGRLDCASGKRMKTENRVFFVSEDEALEAGYRPCGHCMHHAYSQWKAKRTI